jgi:hypothetical protein
MEEAPRGAPFFADQWVRAMKDCNTRLTLLSVSTLPKRQQRIAAGRARVSGIRCRIENCVQSFMAVNLNHVPPDAILVCAGARLLSVRAIIAELPALVIRTVQPIEMR